ncbi:hypothetical protein ACXGQW_02660 [Wenyingzhuangia sp. IMCC45533]
MKNKPMSLFCIICALTLVSCGSNSDEIDESNSSNSGQLQIKPQAATSVVFVGESISTDNAFDYSTLDLDESNEDDTYVQIQNYEATYTYVLKLTGIYSNEKYTVTAVDKGNLISNAKQSAVSPSIPSKTLHFDLASLDMKPDFYTGVLLESESGNELPLKNSLSTDSRTIRFTDQGNSEFYTTIRASQTNGVISSNGHPKGLQIKANLYVLTKARAYKNVGETHQLAFYTVTDQTLVKKTATFTRNQSATSGGGPSYFTSIDFISPSNIGLAAGDYLVRMEVFKNGVGIIKKSPFQKFKISN